jgi:hypothetical protein
MTRNGRQDAAITGTVEAGILPASERGFQPQVLSSLPGLRRFLIPKPTDESAGNFLSP